MSRLFGIGDPLGELDYAENGVPQGFPGHVSCCLPKTGWQVQAYRLMSNSVGRRGQISTFDTAVSIFYTAKMALFSEGHQSPDCQLGATTAMAEDAASGEASAWAWV